MSHAIHENTLIATTLDTSNESYGENDICIYILGGSVDIMASGNFIQEFKSKKGWFIQDQVLIYKSPGFTFSSLPQTFTFFDFDNVIIDYEPETVGRSVELIYTDNIERMPERFIVVSNKGANLRWYSKDKRKDKLAHIRRVFDEAGKRFQDIHKGKTEYLVILPLEDVVWSKPMPVTWEVFIKPFIGDRKAIFVGDAAGRMGDFAVSDRSYVYNINRVEGKSRVRFKTPEEYFGIDKKPTIHNISGQRKNYSEKKLSEYVWDPNGFYPFRGVKSKKIRLNKGTKVVFLIGPPGAGQVAFCKAHGIEPARSPEEAKKFVESGKVIAIGAINKTAQATLANLGPSQNVLIDITLDQYFHWSQQKLFSFHLQKNKFILSAIGNTALSRVLSIVGYEMTDKELIPRNYSDYMNRRSWIGPVISWRPTILPGFMYDPSDWNPNWHKPKKNSSS